MSEEDDFFRLASNSFGKSNSLIDFRFAAGHDTGLIKLRTNSMEF